MAITFPVCDVVCVDRRLPEVSLRAAVQGLLGTPFEACGARLDSVVATPANAFLFAARMAHAEHRPLVLTPDAVWLCLAQGFAQHVNLHAEELRGRFVGHDGREPLIVQENTFIKGSPDNPWPLVFTQFSRQIAGRIGRQRDLIVCDFSTTGPIERAASEIVLMDAMQSYFDYVLQWICGIPEVTLAGTVDDWRSIHRRAQHFAEYGLEWWTAVLLPALEQIIAAASGRPDIPFWRSFFNSATSGGCDPTTRISGWILLLFPYLTGGCDDPSLRANSFITDARGASPVHRRGGPASWISRPCVEPDSFPLGLARAPMLWKSEHADYAMELIGGFVGVAQDNRDLALTPTIGWAVRDQGDAARVPQPRPRARDPYARSTATAEVTDADLAMMFGDGDGIYRPEVAEFPDLVLQPVRCSRAATPEGRLILAATTDLYFINAAAPDERPIDAPGDEDADLQESWSVGLALMFAAMRRPDSKDSFAAMFGSPPAEQVAAIPGSFHLDPSALARSTFAHDNHDIVTFTVPLSTGEHLRFEFRNERPEVLAAWITRLRYV